MAQLMDYTRYFAEHIGPRPAGTEEEHQAALYVTEQFQKEAGFTANIEEFSNSSNPELVGAILAGVVIVVSILAVFLPFLAIPMFVLGAVAAALFVLEAIDRPVISRLLPQGASQNVVAKYQPNPDAEAAGRARSRKLILVAHYDTGRVQPSLISRMEASGLPITLMTIIAMVAAAVLLLLRIFVATSGGGLLVVLNVLTIVALIVCLYPVLQTILVRTSPYNEGANNNATGTAALIEIARRISRGSVSEAELAADFDDDEVTIHGEDAARSAGLVPEGAQIRYEAEQIAPPSMGDYDEEERLLAAKAAIAALTGKPVERHVYGSVADNLVNSRSHEHGLDSDAAMENAPEPMQPLPERTYQSYENVPVSAPEGFAVQTQPEPESEPDSSGNDAGFKNAPSWFLAAQKNARRSPEAESENTEVHRSRYTEAIERGERERREREEALMQAERERVEAEQRAREQEARELLEQRMGAPVATDVPSDAPETAGSKDALHDQRVLDQAMDEASAERDAERAPEVLAEHAAEVPAERAARGSEEDTRTTIESQEHQPRSAARTSSSGTRRNGLDDAFAELATDAPDFESITAGTLPEIKEPEMPAFITGEQEAVDNAPEQPANDNARPSVHARTRARGSIYSEDRSQAFTSSEEPGREQAEEAPSDQDRGLHRASASAAPDSTQAFPSYAQLDAAAAAAAAANDEMNAYAERRFAARDNAEVQEEPARQLSMSLPEVDDSAAHARTPVPSSADYREENAPSSHARPARHGRVDSQEAPSQDDRLRNLRTSVPSLSGVIRTQNEARRSVASSLPSVMNVPESLDAPKPRATTGTTDALPSHELRGGTADAGSSRASAVDDGPDYEMELPVRSPANQPEPMEQRPMENQAAEIDQYDDFAQDDGYDGPDTPQQQADYEVGNVSMPGSRAGGFLSRFRHKNEEPLEETPQEWLNVDENFEARSVGRARGGWESFRQDSPDYQGNVADDDFGDEFGTDERAPRKRRSWEGGAYSRMQLGHVDMRSGEDAEADEVIPDEPIEAALDRDLTGEIEQIYHFRNPAFNTEIWFVAIGSDNATHDGARAFLEEHQNELRGSMVIEVESLGAGALSVASQEGKLKKVNASSRIKRMTREATAKTGIALDEVSLAGTDSIASTVQKAGYQAMHLFGAENGRPALKGDPDDTFENIDEFLLDDHVNFIFELLKNR